jgi:HD-like signal output (HDOD) protein
MIGFLTSFLQKYHVVSLDTSTPLTYANNADRKQQNRTLQITDALLTEVMAKLHAQEGGKLLKQWNMPEYLCTTARDHHNVKIDEKNYLLLLLRMANLVCHKLGIGLKQDAALSLPATMEAHLLKLTEIDLAELKIALEDTAVLSG